MIDLEKVREVLTDVYDPELGLNVVELGLIYKIEETTEGQIEITMTLTTPGCPMHDTISQAVQWACRQVEGVQSAHVQVVWEPAWGPDKMTAEARAKLGF